MARPSKSKNEQNPLNQLRRVFGKKDTPIFQAELGRILGIPPNTIKAVEAGRRKLSARMRKQALLYCGAVWDEESKRWTSFLTNKEYSRKDHEAWRKAEYDREMEIHAVCLQVMVLLQSTEDTDFKTVIGHLQDVIEQTKKGFRIRVVDPAYKHAVCRSGIPMNEAGHRVLRAGPVYGYRWVRPSLYLVGSPHKDEQGFVTYDPKHPEWYTKVKLFDFTDKIPKAPA